MKVAVLSLTRNRLDYTKHCFAALRENAGCYFDHYVFDQGSTDGTRAWIDLERRAERLAFTWYSNENVGIHKGMNKLLSATQYNRRPGYYDVIVKVDNDCEVTVPGTLKAVAELQLADPGSMVGPVVNGLRGPMPLGPEREVAGYRVALTPMIGGIMQPIPPGWRYDENMAPWGGDDGLLSKNADWCGQLLDYPVNHYRTTDGQHDDYPEYFEERVGAGGPA